MRFRVVALGVIIFSVAIALRDTTGMVILTSRH